MQPVENTILMRANEESADMSRQLKAYMLIQTTVAFLPRSESGMIVSLSFGHNYAHSLLSFHQIHMFLQM